MVPHTSRTSRSPSPSRQPPAHGHTRTHAPTPRITQAHLDPSDHRTIACVAVVLGPADTYAYHCLASLQASLDERVQVVEVGTEDDRLLLVQRALSGRVGPGTVALVIQCGTGGQTHPDLAGLAGTFDELACHADGTGLSAPVVVCSDEHLREETCIAQVIARREWIEGPVGSSQASRPSPPPASNLSLPSLVDMPWPALATGPPIGLVLVKIGRLSEWDENLVDELAGSIGNMPMVCTQYPCTPVAMKNLKDLHANRGTPQTAYIVLCDGSDDTDVVSLCAALLLKLNILPHTYSHDNDNPLLPFDVADRAAQAYAKALIEHDRRYLDNFKDWAIDLDNHKGNPMALYQYLVQVLARSRDDVLGEVDLCLDDPNLWRLPPLPPRNITRLSLIGCPIAWIRGLPLTLRELTIRHPIMVGVDIDPDEVPLLKRVDLRGLDLWRTPPWVDGLPDDVEVLLPYPSSEDEPFDVDPRSNDEPAATHPSDDAPERCATPITEALRHWSDTPRSHLLELDWQSLERLPGANGFARLLVRLSQDARFATAVQGARIANLLSGMRKDLALARLIMEVAVGADDTCIDRASLTWHFVELACESHALLQQRPLSLPTILDHARQVLRRTLLMDKANEKITQLRSFYISLGEDPDDKVDEVEVVLAFLEWSQGALKIRKNPYAQFTRTAISKVEMREVSVAVREIRAFEDAQFEVFLTDWQPWRDVLSALMPERMDAIEQTCSDIDGIDAAARRELAQQGVANADTAIVSNEDRTRISNAIRREGVIRLTHEVLEEQRHLDLLGPYWASQ